MPDPVRALTRLFRWGATVPVGITYGAETDVARRFRALLQAQAPAGSGEELRRALLPIVKSIITAERAELERMHRAGAGGLEVVALHAELVDAVICELFRLAEARLAEPVRDRTEGCAVIALGGYGRRELNPASDVDVMFLYPRRVDAYVSAILDQVLYFLWDLGFTVGHSCRSLGDTVQMMETDITVRTALLEGRFLVGNQAVFADLQARMWRTLQGRRAQQYVQRKLQEQAQRHAKFGGSVFVQEPNVKEGWGGLRDFHVALWVARARHRLSDLGALPALGLLSP